jgi:hypothetical protein
MSLQRHRIESADRRAKELAQMNDLQFADTYVATLLSRENIHFSAYLVTAVRDLGLWPRLETALAARNAPKR